MRLNSLPIWRVSGSLATCFSWTSRHSCSDVGKKRVPAFTTDVDITFESFVDDSEILERAEEGSASASDINFSSELEHPTDFMSLVPEVERLNRVFPLCSDMDRNLADKSSSFYVPAIPFSRLLNPKRDCNMRQFRLGRQVGKGGFGNVYTAIHKRSNEVVALKMVPYGPGSNIDMVHNRHEECLQHRMEGFSAIPRHYCTFEYAFNKQRRYAVHVMELVDGEELFTVLYDSAQSKYFPAYGKREVVKWAAQLIAIVSELQRRNIVLLDLKPENVLVERDGTLRLLDFGLAGDPTKPSEYLENRIMGTDYYFPPEYLNQEYTGSQDDDKFNPDELHWHQPAADWYALGVLLYEIAFRKCPFPNSKTDPFKYMRFKFDRVSFPPILSEHEAFLADLIDGLLEIDPKQRLGIRPDSEEVFATHPLFNTVRVADMTEMYLAPLLKSKHRN